MSHCLCEVWIQTFRSTLYIQAQSRAPRGIFFSACRTPKSPRTSSAPAKTLNRNLTSANVNFKKLASGLLASNPDVRWYYHYVSIQGQSNTGWKTHIFDILAHTGCGERPTTENLGAVCIKSEILRFLSLSVTRTLRSFPARARDKSFIRIEISFVLPNQFTYCFSNPIGPANKLDCCW